MISGYFATSTNLPGYRGYTCNQLNCPVGDTTTQRNNFGGNYEIQRVVCPLSNISSFTMTFKGFSSEVIYATYDAFQIKEALEYMPTLGNISVSFPMAYNDTIVKIFCTLYIYIYMYIYHSHIYTVCTLYIYIYIYLYISLTYIHSFIDKIVHTL
jgi:hypothetical protein